MPQKLWEANSQIKSKSNLFKFEKFLANKLNNKPDKNFKKGPNDRKCSNCRTWLY